MGVGATLTGDARVPHGLASSKGGQIRQIPQIPQIPQIRRYKLAYANSYRAQALKVCQCKPKSSGSCEVLYVTRKSRSASVIIIMERYCPGRLTPPPGGRGELIPVRGTLLDN